MDRPQGRHDRRAADRPPRARARRRSGRRRRLDSEVPQLGLLSGLADRAVNRTAQPGRLNASDAALQLHERGPVVDLLVGTALFRDTFIERGSRGQVDLPRLRAAGVNVVGLTVATRFPDLRGSLSRFHFRSMGAPRREMATNMGLAEWLIGRIEKWCRESAGRLVIIRTRADLEECLATGGPVGVLLNVQGGHVLDGRVDNVARLRELGVRMFAPAHVMDNALVGSGTGRAAGGLSSFGRDVIAELEGHSMLVDLAHMSVPGIESSLPLLRRPFTLSHTGLTEVAGRRSRWRRYSAATRNIPASLAADIGGAGGLIGVVLASQLLGGDDLGAAVRTIAALLSTVGAAGVAIGSDMDGALRQVIDAEGLPALTSALLESGLPAPTVSAVMGANAVDLLRRVLPDD